MRWLATIILLVVIATGTVFQENPRSCLIIGDSIAVALSERILECTANAQSGITSQAIINLVGSAPVLVISAGTNDGPDDDLKSDLIAIRARATDQVIWVLPADPSKALLVANVAREHWDATVDFISTDGAHPSSYERLVKTLRRAVKYQVFQMILKM